MNVFHILIGDLNDRNIVDVYFIFLYQMEQQIQRPLKRLKLYGNSHNDSSFSS